MHLTTLVSAVAQAAVQGGGTMAAVRRSLPTNPAAVFTLVLSAVGIAAVVVGGRGKGGPGPDGKK